jgi:NF-X1-type zinc finger protein NFXL1
MSGYGRGYSRGRGSSRGRGVWQQGEQSSSKPTRAATRPYKRSQSSTGRGSTQPHKRPSHESAGVAPEKTSASQQVLARAAAIRESASQFARDECESSDDSSDCEGESEGRELIKNMLKMYYQQLTSNDGEGDIDSELVQAAMMAAAGSCLVCLCSIKRVDPVWSCAQCYCLFHLQCIQQWARDGERQLSLLSVELFPGQEIHWSCPKCRLDYPTSQFPKTYVCFCGKHIDPPVDPWLLPHSCGEICDKPLQPECGHCCVSLCHPGQFHFQYELQWNLP